MVHCTGDMQGQRRIRKLIERKDHIESEIELLEDRHFIIEGEIAAEMGKLA
jgi:hypothetical protein